jgi:NAD-dependent SIR2 family protein deacetylase
MGVDATCTDCKEALVNDNLSLGDGKVVQISKCPKCEGKIKSPMCCGADMSCAV